MFFTVQEKQREPCCLETVLSVQVSDCEWIIQVKISHIILMPSCLHYLVQCRRWKAWVISDLFAGQWISSCLLHPGHPSLPPSPVRRFLLSVPPLSQSLFFFCHDSSLGYVLGNPSESAVPLPLLISQSVVSRRRTFLSGRPTLQLMETMAVF